MKKFNVSIQEQAKEYPIYIGSQLLPLLCETVKKHKGKNVVITDDQVKKLHGESIAKELNALLISVPVGEQSKSHKVKQEIEDYLFEQGCGRDTLIIAVGGGVIGDLAGYVAATFNRGISFIQVPTSLLAMVDASVGGKTGINTKHGKNLIGCIWQPQAVFIDTAFLQTLPKEELLNGLVESVKMAIILDKALFTYIEDHANEILSLEYDVIEHIIQRCIALKSDIVMQDERESGIRKILNFGHTIGHGIEKHSNYTIKHGYAVSMGMVAEAQLAVHKKVLSQKDYDRIVQLLQQLGLPITSETHIPALWNTLQLDKKTIKGIPHYVLLKEIGKIDQQSVSLSKKELDVL